MGKRPPLLCNVHVDRLWIVLDVHGEGHEDVILHDDPVFLFQRKDPVEHVRPQPRFIAVRANLLLRPFKRLHSGAVGPVIPGVGIVVRAQRRIVQRNKSAESVFLFPEENLLLPPPELFFHRIPFLQMPLRRPVHEKPVAHHAPHKLLHGDKE